MFAVRVERTGSDGKSLNELYAAKKVTAELDSDGGKAVVHLDDGEGYLKDVHLEGIAVAYVMNSKGNTVWKIQTSSLTKPKAEPRGPNGEVTGLVVRLIKDKGFGFVNAEGNEFFFRRNSVVTGFESLREGVQVTFQESNGPKGLRAESVREVGK